MSLALNSFRKLSISKLVSESCLNMSSVSLMGPGSSCIAGTKELRSDWESSPRPPVAPVCCPTATEAASLEKIHPIKTTRRIVLPSSYLQAGG